MTTFTEPKFPCGVLLATPGASEAFARNQQTPLSSFNATSTEIGARNFATKIER